MTVNDKHYLLNRDNVMQPIKMQLSQKKQTFSQFFFWFLKSKLNWKYLPTKDDPHSWCISGNTGSEKYVQIDIWKAVFQRTLRQTTWQMGRNTVAIWMTVPLQYLLITVKVLGLEKFSFGDSSNSEALF